MLIVRFLTWSLSFDFGFKFAKTVIPIRGVFFLFLRYGHYIQQFLARQFRQSWDVLGKAIIPNVCSEAQYS